MFKFVGSKWMNKKNTQTKLDVHKFLFGPLAKEHLLFCHIHLKIGFLLLFFVVLDLDLQVYCLSRGWEVVFSRQKTRYPNINHHGQMVRNGPLPVTVKSEG